MHLDVQYTARWAARLARVLDGPVARWLSLASAVATLIPFSGDRALLTLTAAAWFTALALLRSALHGWRARRTGVDHALLAVDWLVVLTFLPWEALAPGLSPERLHSLWMIRLAILLRPSRAFLTDLVAILTRRERLQQFTTVSVVVFGLSLLSAVLLTNVAPPLDYDGDGVIGPDDDFLDVLWWTFRQLESADNLVPDLRRHGVVIAVSLGLTLVGVFIIAFIIGIGAQVVEQVMAAERRRPVDYEDHTVVVGPVHEAEALVRSYVEMQEKNRGLRRIGLEDVWRWALGRGPRPRRHALPLIALLGTDKEAPGFLIDDVMRKVRYRRGSPYSPAALHLVGAHRARRVLLLGPPGPSPSADAAALASLGALRTLTQDAFAYVELFDPDNHAIADAVGGPRTIPLDVPRILGQILSAHLVVRGAEDVFHHLLTTDGSEIYTHVFLEPWETAALAAWGAEAPTVSFSTLAALGRRHGVTLMGVILGPRGRAPRRGGGGVPFEGLTPWLNPQASPPPPSPGAPAAAVGEIPLDRLAGLIGLADTYKDMKDLAQALLRDRPTPVPPGAPSPQAVEVAARAIQDGGDLARVLVVGDSPALAALVTELVALVPGVELTLMLRASPQPLEERLAGLALRFADAHGDPSVGGLRAPLAGGRGEVRILTAPDGRLEQRAAELALGPQPFQAAAFLSEDGPGDPDPRVAHRVLRFAQAVSPRCQEGLHCHLLVELRAPEQGVLLTRDVARMMGEGAPLRVTPLSTDRIRNYFMVHSAFVPGVDRIYAELLGVGGQDLMSLSLPHAEGTLSFGALREGLQARGFLALGYALKGERGVVNPPDDRLLPLYRLTTVYALGDVPRPPRASHPMHEDVEDRA